MNRKHSPRLHILYYIHLDSPETVGNNEKKEKYTKTDLSDITHSGDYGYNCLFFVQAVHLVFWSWTLTSIREQYLYNLYKIVSWRTDLPQSPNYLTLPSGWVQSTPALRPQYGPNAQPRLTSWSKKSLRGFCKPQDSGPMDTVKLIQWECIVTEDSSPE